MQFIAEAVVDLVKQHQLCIKLDSMMFPTSMGELSIGLMLDSH
jgi:hypothetical protein